jgi:hypothetical protein
MLQSPIFSNPTGPTGGSKNLYEISTYIKPILDNFGFTCTKFEGRADNIQLISAVDDKKSFVAQIFYVQQVKDIASKSRISIPPKIVNLFPMDERVKETLYYLEMNDIWLFISVRNRWYVLIKYTDIPEEGWNLSYRHKPGDRMYIKPTYLAKIVKPYTRFKRDIQNILSHDNK